MGTGFHYHWEEVPRSHDRRGGGTKNVAPSKTCQICIMYDSESFDNETIYSTEELLLTPLHFTRDECTCFTCMYVEEMLFL